MVEGSGKGQEDELHLQTISFCFDRDYFVPPIICVFVLITDVNLYFTI